MRGYQVAVEALRLRGWALRVLGGSETLPPPVVSAAAIECFVVGERCTLPLAMKVRAGGGGVPAWLADASVAETKRALSLQERLRLVSRIAAYGLPAVLLKGAVPAVRGRSDLDAADLDLLVAEEDWEQFAEHLSGEGLNLREDAKPGRRSDPQGGWATAQTGEGGIAVELHVSVPFMGLRDFWAAAVPSRLPGLMVPAAVDHLWHVLVHVVEHHPERRGRIRDLVLLADALGSCTTGELEEVHERIERHKLGKVMLRMIEAAAELSEDLFRTEAALRYLLISVTAGMGERLTRRLWSAAFALAGLRGEYRYLWIGGSRSVFGSGDGLQFERRLPWLSAVFRAAWRGVFVGLVTPAAAVLVALARRVAADLPSGSERG